jgi:anti-sigma factor ChrR (cupin superfamily)
VLDADIVAALCDAQARLPEPAPDAAAAARIRQRLMRRAAAAEDGHVTVQAADDRWQPFGHGVQIKVLHEAGGVMSYLLRLEAGASIGAHRHPHDEECVVLEGTLRIGDDLVVPAGGFHLARRGRLHDRIHTDTGAVIFLRGAVPEAAHLV